MNIASVVKNALVQEPTQVWRLPDHEKFGYTDGAASEKYLEHVFTSARDLGSHSLELESQIKDWVSEYHLTTRRAQLLSAFEFERAARVLEVGCGCGAITRFLGETFDEVVSVEGSIHRARLARLRTRDLPNVSIICSPFQKIEFSEQFDFIFCIGVYEYSASFIEGDDPYQAALRYFASMLKPDGVLVIAIENQFGLKYFTSAAEDHIGVMFEGLTGYHGGYSRVRTFGRKELQADLERHFSSVQFFYPYPDYKLPECVLTEQFLSSERAGEVVSQTRSRDYGGARTPLWSESLASLELARNGALPFFANSFLAFAGKAALRGVRFDAQAVFFSSPQRGRFRAVTRVQEAADGSLSVTKQPVANVFPPDGGKVKWLPAASSWIDSHSLATEVFGRSRRRNATLESVFGPCKIWVQMLKDVSTEDHGVRYVGGEYLDCIWSNAYVRGTRCDAVDLEWVWHTRLRMNVVIIRAIYVFLLRVGQERTRPAVLHRRSGRHLIAAIAASLGVETADADFAEFVAVEASLQNIAYSLDERRVRTNLLWFLRDWPSLERFAALRRFAARANTGVRSRLGRLFGTH
jgi:SAM-dependent methyltransferase